MYYLELCIGRSTASVAEQLHMTTEEAQKIIDDFFDAYPAVQRYIQEQQEKAHRLGYTTTAWGRRRYIAHLQDEKYEYHYNNNRPVDFNPLFTARSIIHQEVPQDIKDEYNDKLEKANYYTKKKLIEKAKSEGIDIIDNSSFIKDSNRQILNSIIQGSAADMSKRAMILLGTNQELKDLGFKMKFPVHDFS